MFYTMVKTQYSATIKSVRSDWGGEFQSLYKYFLSVGIKHQISCPYTLQQNGRVEKKNQQIVDVGLSLLHHAQVPQKYWPFAFHEAIVIINHLPSKPVDFQIPV